MYVYDTYDHVVINRTSAADRVIMRKTILANNEFIQKKKREKAALEKMERELAEVKDLGIF